MKQTIKLSIIYFKEQIFSAFQGFNKSAKTKTLPFVILMFLILSSALGYSIYNIAVTLNSINSVQNILYIGLLMAVFLSLMLTLTDTQGNIYISKDFNFLSSLPIKNISIITSKYLGGYLSSMVFYALVAVPTFVVYFIFTKISFFAIIFAVLSILFMPAFAQLLSSLLGFLVNAITAKMKNKNIFRTFFTLFFAIGLAVFIALSNSEIMGQLFLGDVPLWFKIVFSNIYFLFVSINSVSFIYFIYAILVNIAFVVLGIGIILIGYKRINSALMVTKVRGKPAPIVYNQKSIFCNLLKKEYTTFFNSPVYCVNGLVGIIMSLVSTVIVITTFSKFGEDMFVIDILSIIMVSCVSLCLGVAPTTSVSFSIEGNKLQNLKSLPINFKDIVLSKCILNLTLSVPTIIICVIIFGVFSKISFLLSTLILIYLLLATISQSVLGILLNLKFPRLNWTSETQAVKNGFSMILTMVVDMVIGIAPMVVFFIWFFHSSWLSFIKFMPMLIAFQFIYTVILLILIIKKGKDIYNKIQV